MLIMTGIIKMETTSAQLPEWFTGIGFLRILKRDEAK